MNNVNKAFNITIDELLVLLAFKKMDNLYGLFDEDYQTPDRRNINEILFHLNRKGILAFDENKVTISERMDEVLDAIKEAESIIVLSGSNEEVPESCIYKSKKLVYVRHLSGDNGRIRIELLDKNGIIERTKDSEWGIGGNESEVMAGFDKITDSDIGKDYFDLDKNAMCENAEIKNFLLVLNARTGSKIKQLILLSQGVDDYIVMDDGKEREVYPYSKSRTYELIEGILEEKK